MFQAAAHHPRAHYCALLRERCGDEHTTLYHLPQVPAQQRLRSHGSRKRPLWVFWKDKDLFLKWLQHFVQYAPKERPLILILNQHDTHVALQVIIIMNLIGIALYFWNISQSAYPFCSVSSTAWITRLNSSVYRHTQRTFSRHVCINVKLNNNVTVVTVYVDHNIVMCSSNIIVNFKFRTHYC